MSNWFYVDDNPQWLEELEEAMENTQFDECTVSIDDVWSLAKESPTVPHFGNIWTSLVLSNIFIYFERKYPHVEVEFEVNSICSSLTMDGDMVTTYDELLSHAKDEDEEEEYSDE